MRIKLVAACLLYLSSLPAQAEIFVDFGLTSTKTESIFADRDDSVTSTDTGVHLGIGARRSIDERNDIGVRLELDEADSNLFLAVRALDYRHHFSDRIALNLFVGAARLDLATPAYGWYLGAGVDLKEILPRFDLNVDLHYGDKVARDNLLPSDPQSPVTPDNFHDVTGLSIYLSRRF